MNDTPQLRTIAGYQRRLESWAAAAEKLARITVDTERVRQLRDGARLARSSVKMCGANVQAGRLSLAARDVRRDAGELKWSLLASTTTAESVP